jgi:phosphoserine phosphatase
VVGILSDGYEFVAQHIGNKLSADFAVANELEFSNGVATGEVKVPSLLMRTKESICKHNFCKSNAMLHLAEKYGISRANILAIGDSEPDICLIQHAGIGVAFCSTNTILNRTADKVIDQCSFRPILEFAL